MQTPACGFVASCAAAALLVSVLGRSAVAADLRQPERAPDRQVSAPLRFESNLGQVDRRAGFVVRGSAMTAYLAPREAVFAVPSSEAGAADIVRMMLQNTDGKSRGVGELEQTGRASYFVGNDRTKWRTGVVSYARVRYPSVYSGIDLIYHGDSTGNVEYDFVTGPGADVRRIEFRLVGATGVRIEDGDLVASTASGEIRQHRPAVYQDVGGRRRIVSGGFELRSDGSVGFRIADYDRSRPVTIDPVLAYSTLIGGSSSDFANSVAVDPDGFVYLVGGTRALDFPSGVSFPGTTRGEADIFIAKFDQAGTSLMYSIFVGGSSPDVPTSIRVMPDGTVVVRGYSSSTDFPTANAAQPSLGGGQDIVVFKINPAGTAFVYSTYLGGESTEDCFTGLDIDGAGNAYVSGCTQSTRFPVKNAMQATLGGNSDGFLVKYSATGAVLFATYIGGSGDEAAYDVAAGPNGSVYVGGFSSSQDLPTKNAIQPTLDGPYDGFVGKLAPDGQSYVYLTYLGGSGGDTVARIAVDALGAVYAVSQVDSLDFPVVGAFQAQYGGGLYDGAVTKINPSGTAIVYSSFIGGSGVDGLYGVNVDGRGAAFVAGSTDSTDLPLAHPIQSAKHGGIDIFVAHVSPDGASLEFSTYVGGAGDDLTNQAAIDVDGNLYVSFFTYSADFPTVTPFQATLNGTTDPGFFKISDTYSLTWTAPNADGAAPTNLAATLSGTSSTPGGKTDDTRSPRDLTGYNVYRSTGPNVQPTAANLFRSVPPTQTTVPTAPGGSFFVVTATYGDGAESDPSNEAGAGAGASPTLTKVKVTAAKVTAKGGVFTSQVQVFLDGIPFVAPSVVKKGKKVVQSGTLLTGETIAAYLGAHNNQAIVTFRNSNGALATFAYSK